MKILFNLYPEGKHKAMTMSYDDGRNLDLRLARLFDLHGIRGTFHLNSIKFGRDRYLAAQDVAKTFAHHEVSCHTYSHPYLDRIPTEQVVEEITEDRRVLEALCGYPIRGMSYPYGTYSADLIGLLRALGMRYARTIKSTEKFSLPTDFMEWHPTCHHNNERLFELLEKFKKSKTNLALFYLWGHSFEFENDNNWEVIERFCAEAADDPDVWYATNIEIYDYIMALRALAFSADRTIVYNPTATDVWLTADDRALRVAAGATVHLNT